MGATKQPFLQMQLVWKKPSKYPHKIKLTCMLCKCDHLLRDCHGIPKILEVWSTGSHQPLSSTSRDSAFDQLCTSDSKVHGKKGKVKFPCKLREGSHPIHLYPYMDETSKVFETLQILNHQFKPVTKRFLPIPH